MRSHIFALLVLVLAVLNGFALISCSNRSQNPQVLTGGANSAIGVKESARRQVADFTLTNQAGRDWRFRDQAPNRSLVTFIYTHCTDVCPFVAMKMQLAMGILGAKASDVRLVAISTDPERDTVPVIAAYSQALGLEKTWTYLTGTPAQLGAVWKDFNIAVSKTDSEIAIDTARNALELGLDMPVDHPATDIAAGLPQSEAALAEKVAGDFGGGYEIAHTVPFWIVDSQGTLLAMLPAETSPAELAEAIEASLP